MQKKDRIDYVNAISNEKNISALDTFLHPEIVIHMPSLIALYGSGKVNEKVGGVETLSQENVEASVKKSANIKIDPFRKPIIGSLALKYE